MTLSPVLKWQLKLSNTFRKVVEILSTSIEGSGRQVKGKAIPLQAWTGPEGSRKLRLPDFKTIGT